MISHKHKCIFIHIPKTAGMSVNSFFYPDIRFHHTCPDYERLFGWCPKRKIHMQHATSKQLLETGLVTEEQWNTYYKFTFVRNPWDRAYSDFLWIQNLAKIKGTFKDYIAKKGEFREVLIENINYDYLGDHLIPQTSFFDMSGKYEMDFIGRFENFSQDIHKVLLYLNIHKKFDIFNNKSKRRFINYSNFYTNSKKRMVEEKFKKDIELLKYEFIDNRTGLFTLKIFL